MGCDGGTIPTRDELVRTKKRPEQKDKDSERLFKWQHCHLTQEPLRKPIAACQLGRLYNKEAVIERLLDKSTPDLGHIKSLKDIRQLELTPNPNAGAKKTRPSVSDGYVDSLNVSAWICPVTGLEMNGRFRFVFDWTDGKVLSERAYKMVMNDRAAKIAEEDMVTLNPVDENEVDLLRAKMEARKARLKAEKKAKKESSSKRKTESEDGKEKKDSNGKVKKSKIEEKSSQKQMTNGSGNNSASTSSSVQNDPTKSEVYKSLFSSHKSAQKKEKAHWVTFDPRYN